MLDVGIYERRSVIILDLVGDDFMQLIRDNTVYSPQYYETVCQCAKQLVIIAQLFELRICFDFRFFLSTDRSTQIYS